MLFFVVFPEMSNDVCFKLQTFSHKNRSIISLIALKRTKKKTARFKIRDRKCQSFIFFAKRYSAKYINIIRCLRL